MTKNYISLAHVLNIILTYSIKYYKLKPIILAFFIKNPIYLKFILGKRIKVLINKLSFMVFLIILLLNTVYFDTKKLLYLHYG